MTRRSILDAARELFEREGYLSVGLEAVAKKAGVSRQAIYLHFESKGDLVRALHDRIYEIDVEPVTSEIWSAPTALDGLDAFVVAGGGVIPRIFAIAKALGSARPVDPEADAAWHSPAEARYADCVRLAKWLRTDGMLAPNMRVGDAADMIWMLTGFGSYESLVMDRGWSVRRWVDWTRDMLGRVLLDAGAYAHRA